MYANHSGGSCKFFFHITKKKKNTKLKNLQNLVFSKSLVHAYLYKYYDGDDEKKSRVCLMRRLKNFFVMY